MSTAAPAQDTHDHAQNGRGAGPADLSHLRHVVEHAAHLLPAQGPITVFIHHNTPHAFEDRPFVEGVEQGARICGRNWATRPTPCARSAGGCGPAGCSSTG